MVQAVFFDFDGVIADSEPLHLRAYQAVLEPAGIQLEKEDYYARYLGYDDEGMFQAVVSDRGLAVDGATIDKWIASKSNIVEEMLSASTVLFPGAATCVRMFADRGVPLAIASGALEPEIAMVLEHAGLRECFAAIASASDGVRGKPAPDLYLLAIAKLRERVVVEPSACIAIEDSHWGLEAARSAGLRCVAVAHTYAASELGIADLVVNSLGELTLNNIDDLLRDNGPRI
jgi:beta-phosphoglucomutase